MMRSMLGLRASGITLRRFFSMVRSDVSCRRRTTKSLMICELASKVGRARGLQGGGESGR